MEMQRREMTGSRSLGEWVSEVGPGTAFCVFKQRLVLGQHEVSRALVRNVK